MKMAASPSIGPKLFWTGPNCFEQCPNMFGQFENVENQTKNNFLTYFISHFEPHPKHVMSKQFWTCSKQFGRVQNYFGLLKGQGISNLKVTKSGEDECFISRNTNVIWIGVEIKVTSYYCSSPLGHEDGSQSACSDDASACWTWSLGGYYTRRKGLLCSASIMASKMVGESKAAHWNLVWVLSIEFRNFFKVRSSFRLGMKEL